MPLARVTGDTICGPRPPLPRRTFPYPPGSQTYGDTVERALKRIIAGDKKRGYWDNRTLRLSDSSEFGDYSEHDQRLYMTAMLSLSLAPPLGSRDGSRCQCRRQAERAGEGDGGATKPPLSPPSL